MLGGYNQITAPARAVSGNLGPQWTLDNDTLLRRLTAGHRALSAGIVVRIHAQEPIVTGEARYDTGVCCNGSLPVSKTVRTRFESGLSRQLSTETRSVNHARVAQLDRATDFESEGCKFESCRERQLAS